MCRALLLALLLGVTGAVTAFNDPTRPPAVNSVAPTAGSSKAASWELSSILINGERSIAIINGIALSAGDMVGGARVISVEAARVTLQQGNRKFSLGLTDQIKRNTRTDNRGNVP